MRVSGVWFLGWVCAYPVGLACAERRSWVVSGWLVVVFLAGLLVAWVWVGFGGGGFGVNLAGGCFGRSALWRIWWFGCLLGLGWVSVVLA